MQIAKIKGIACAVLIAALFNGSYSLGAERSRVSQLLVVLADSENSHKASIYLTEATFPKEPQLFSTTRADIVAGPFPAVIGSRGIANGPVDLSNEFSGMILSSYQYDKKEGDLRTPSGLFRIGRLMGSSPMAPILSNLDYVQISPEEKNADIFKLMLEIQYNKPNRANEGSGIYLHIWRGPGRGTAGCVATSEQTIRQIVNWIKPNLREEPLILILKKGDPFVGFLTKIEPYDSDRLFQQFESLFKRHPDKFASIGRSLFKQKK